MFSVDYLPLITYDFPNCQLLIFNCQHSMLKQFINSVTAADLVYLTGLMPFTIWLIRTSFGKKALSDSPPRRNNMPAYLPFAMLIFWILLVSVSISASENLLPDLPDWQRAFADNFIFCVSALILILSTLFSVNFYFVGNLKGFGLNPKTIIKDFFAAMLNFISIWPITLVVVILTMLIGQIILGDNFQIQQHEELKTIAAYQQLSLKILIIVTTIFVVPVFEEIIFRGLFQTIIRSYLSKPWRSIAISSVIFAMFHENPAHWPALFVLSMCMGYSYEKSGSLFRPIFIHCIFNATSVIATLYQ